MNNAFTDLLRMGERSKALCVPLCRGILTRVVASSAMKEIRDIECLASITDAFTSVEKLCRAILHIFNDDGEHQTRTSDVQWFTDYTGASLFEKTFKVIFRSEGSFWKREVEEIWKKGASSLLLKPIVGGDQIASLQVRCRR